MNAIQKRTTLDRVANFLLQLSGTGMKHEDAIKCGYDFCLAQCRMYAERAYPHDGALPANEEVNLMQEAADLLERATTWTVQA